MGLLGDASMFEALQNVAVELGKKYSAAVASLLGRKHDTSFSLY